MKFLGLTLAVLLISGFVAIEARSVEKRNVVNDLMARAQTALNEAKTQFSKFIHSAFNQQITLARESFLKGLEQFQGATEDALEEGADNLVKYLPGLQGIVGKRVDDVTASLESYIAANKGKFDEVRTVLLQNALKTLKALKDRLRGTKTPEAVDQIVDSVANVENQVVNEVSTKPKSKRSVVDTLMARAKAALNEAKVQFTKFFSSAISQQIAAARESFVKGLEQFQSATEDIVEEGADALVKYLPGLQGVVASRVDTVTGSLDSYIASNKGKLDEVRQLLLENALKTLKALKDRLRGTKSTEAVNQIVSSAENVENQVVNEVSSLKSRSLFGINWNGLKNTVQERLNGLRTRLDESSPFVQASKIAAQKEKIDQTMEKINEADKLSSAEKIEAVKQATAELDQADEAIEEVASSVEESTSASA